MRYLVQITKPAREQDLIVDFDKLNDALIFISQFGFTNDGYRIISYENASGDLRGGSVALLRIYGQNGVTQLEFTNQDTAKQHLATLHESDGYEIIDLEQPVGSKPSLIIGRQPSLWKSQSQEEPAAERQNGWTRNDPDRI